MYGSSSRVLHPSHPSPTYSSEAASLAEHQILVGGSAVIASNASDPGRGARDQRGKQRRDSAWAGVLAE